MSNFEGPSQFDQDDGQPEQPFDYLAEAERLRQERESAEREKKERQQQKKSADKQRRASTIARQLERSAKERKARLERTEVNARHDEAIDLRDHIRDARAQAKKAEATLDEMRHAGDAVRRELKEGQEAVVHLQTAAERAETRAEVADEVAARAEAVRKAREQLEKIEAAEVGAAAIAAETVTHPRVEKTVYDLGKDKDLLQNRLDKSWSKVEPKPTTPTPQAEAVPAALEPEQVASKEQLERRDFEQSHEQPDETAPDAFDTLPPPVEAPPLPLFKTEETLVATPAKIGVFAGELKINHDVSPAEVPAVETTLPPVEVVEEEHELVNEVPAEAPFDDVTHDKLAETQSATAEQPPSAIPQWIRSFETSIGSGVLPEMKKWQRDVLKAQHPDILKRYETLDHMLRGEIAQSRIEEPLPVSPEQLNRPRQSTVYEPMLPVPASLSTDYEPAYMNEAAGQQTTPIRFLRPARRGLVRMALESLSYRVVLGGGAAFGLVLILLFGR